MESPTDRQSTETSMNDVIKEELAHSPNSIVTTDSGSSVTNIQTKSMEGRVNSYRPLHSTAEYWSTMPGPSAGLLQYSASAFNDGEIENVHN